jgi:hypothetical protein
MITAEQIPDEVVQVIRKACDSGEPWNIRDTLAAGLAAWPGADYRPGAKVTKTWTDPGKIILPIKETPNAK